MSEGSSDEGSQPHADTTAGPNDRANTEAEGDARSAAEPVQTQTELAPESQEDDLDAGWEELLGDALQDRPTRSLRGATDPSRTRTSVSMRAPTLTHVPVVSVADAPGAGATPTLSSEPGPAPMESASEQTSEPSLDGATSGEDALQPAPAGKSVEAAPRVQAEEGPHAPPGTPHLSAGQLADETAPMPSRGLLTAVAGLTAVAAVGGYLWLAGSQPEPPPAIPQDSNSADHLAVNHEEPTKDAREAGLLPGQDERVHQAGDRPSVVKDGQPDGGKNPAKPDDTAADAKAQASGGANQEADNAADSVVADTHPVKLAGDDREPGQTAADDALPEGGNSKADPNTADDADPDPTPETNADTKDETTDGEPADVPLQRQAPPGTPKANARALRRIPVEEDDQVPLGGIGRSGIHVDKAGFGREYKEYTCQGENAAYSLSKRHKAHLCVRLVHGRKAETVTIRWLRKGKQVASKKVRVHAKRHVDGAYDVFKFRKGKHRPGPWSVVVQTARGVELLRYDFRVRR